MQGYEGVSVFSCSPPEGIGGWVVGERSAYHSPLLIKTNDSRCRTVPGRGTAGRLVCVGGLPSLPPPSILFRSPLQYRLKSHPTMCIARKKKRRRSKCKFLGVMHYKSVWRVDMCCGKKILSSSKRGNVLIMAASQWQDWVSKCSSNAFKMGARRGLGVVSLQPRGQLTYFILNL